MIIEPQTITEPGRIEIPALDWKGRNSPSHSFSYDIENLGTSKPAYEIGPDSLTLGYQADLFEIALLSKLGKDAGVSDEVKEAALAHYNVIASEKNKGTGNWNSTAIDYDTDFGKPSIWLPKGYERIGVIDISEWKEKGGILVPEGEIIESDAPGDNFAALTKDGLYQASGIPFETTDRKEAKRRLMELALQSGMDKEPAQYLAENNVSYFCRSNKGQGYEAVCRKLHHVGSGPFYVDANWGANFRSRRLGSFPSRSSGKKK